MRKVLWMLLVLAGVSGVVGCKKDNPKVEPEPVPETVDVSDERYLRDSTVYYMKLLSLWQEYLVPTNVNDILKEDVLYAISKKYKTADEVLDYMTSLTPIDPTTNKPIDRYSFLDREGSVSDEIQNAIATSYGMYVFYLQTEEAFNDNKNAYLYVKMVDVNSPAYAAGIRRGDRIMSINGKTTYDYNTQNAENFKSINAALSSPSMTVKWRTPTSVDTEKLITSSQYSFDPILSHKVIDAGGKKVGYLAFSSFVNIENKGVKTKMFSDFESIFSGFESSGVDQLIIDLRYNGGGAVNTAEYLADKIVPASADKKQMFYYKVNNVMDKDWGLTKEGEDFAPVLFNKKGSLNVTKVYFLVTKSTASASELLINVLKPYMNVQVIGSEKTYGKPVGFFGFPTGKGKAMAEIYVTSFQMFNSAKSGDYFGGLALDKTTREDFLKDFGDPSEGFLAEAIYHIKNNSYSTATKTAIASKDKLRVDKSSNIKNINFRASDLGMFKFERENLKFK